MNPPFPDLPDEVIDDILQWAEKKLTNGNKTISFRECKKGVKKLAKKYGQELPKGWKYDLKRLFDRIDKSGNGKINAEEWAVAKAELLAQKGEE